MPSHTRNNPRSTSMKCASSLWSRTFPTWVAAAPTIEAPPAPAPLFPPLASHLVAAVAYCFDYRAGLAQLGSDPPDMDIHGTSPSGVAVAPGPLEQRLAREYPAAVLAEEPQQLELLVG